MSAWQQALNEYMNIYGLLIELNKYIETEWKC